MILRDKNKKLGYILEGVSKGGGYKNKLNKKLLKIEICQGLLTHPLAFLS